MDKGTSSCPEKIHKCPTSTWKDAQMISHQENANPNYNEIALHTDQDGYNQNVK